ncbi:MAG: hypothetical protein ABR561_02625, partial [Guyparkeria sp.]
LLEHYSREVVESLKAAFARLCLSSQVSDALNGHVDERKSGLSDPGIRDGGGRRFGFKRPSQGWRGRHASHQ